ncbi:MAG: hypothetical protein OXE45_18105, partial [bacterium]|nr:hypothetical protein [bacterium]
ANGVLSVSWKNPPDSGQSYSVTVAADGASRPSWRTKSFASPTTRWAMLAAPTKAYRAEIRSNGMGGPVYSQAESVTCPALSSPDYNGPNVPKGLPGYVSWIEPFLKLFCIDDACTNWQNVTTYGTTAVYVPPFMSADYAIVPRSRDCNISTDPVTKHVTQTCDETWNEHITARLDESSLDETAAHLIDWYVPNPQSVPEVMGELRNGVGTLAGWWTLAKKMGKKGVKGALKVSGLATIAHVTGTWIYYEGGAPWAEINGLDGCIFDQPEDRGDDIKNWTATTWPNPNDANQRRSSTTTVNNVTTIRRSVVHYCLESD